MCCGHCIQPRSYLLLILQPLRSGVSATIPVVSILLNTRDTSLTSQWNSQQNLTELITFFFFKHGPIMTPTTPCIPGFCSLLLIKMNLLHYLKYWNLSRFYSRLCYLFLCIALLFQCSLVLFEKQTFMHIQLTISLSIY